MFLPYVVVTMKYIVVICCLFVFIPVGCNQNDSTTKSMPPKDPLVVDQTIEKAEPSSHPIAADTAFNVHSPVEMPMVAEAEPNASEANANHSHGEPLDLSDFYDAPATRFSKSDRHPWSAVPVGKKIFANVSLDIGGRLSLWGSANAARGMVFPEFVEAIPVDRKFESLYLYHATFFSAPDGTPVVRLIMNYETGDSSVSEICYGADVRDWYLQPIESDELKDSRSKRVWKGDNPLSQSTPQGQLQFFITEIANPQPMDIVKTIDFVSAKELPASCIMAVTTGPAGLLKVESPPK